MSCESDLQRQHGMQRPAASRRRLPLLVGILLGGWVVLASGVPGAGAAEPVGYTLVPEQSQITVVLRRDGALSVLAHDHVLVARNLDATLSVALTDLERSAAELSLRVAELVVDAPADRQAAGLVDMLEEDSREEIRGNMLGAEGLEAGRFPEIRMRLVRARGAPSEADLTVALRIHGVEREYGVFVCAADQRDRSATRSKVTVTRSSTAIAPSSAV